MKPYSFIDRNIGRAHALFHRTRMSWPVWYYLLNRESRRHWHTHRVELSSIEKKITSELKRDGITLTHISELFPEKSEFESMRSFLDARMSDPAYQHEVSEHQKLVRERAELIAQGKKYKGKLKDFVVKPWLINDRDTVDFSNPFMRWGFSDSVLAIASSYLGVAPTFIGASLYQTLLVSPNAPEVLSQTWHRDPDDKKMIKFFIYMTDVDDAGAGPFCYVRGTQYGGRHRHLWPQRPPVGSHPPMGEVERAVPSGDILACLGKAGTIIIADTSGLHKGGYSTTRERILCDVDFATRATYQPVRYGLGDASAELSPLARHALRIV